MKHGEDPRRLGDMTFPDSPLAEGIAAARARGPSDAQLRAVRDGVFASIGIATVVTSSAVAGSAAKSAAAIGAQGWWSALVAKVAIAVAVGGAVTGSSVAAWRWHAQTRSDVRKVSQGRAQPKAAEAFPALPATMPPASAQSRPSIQGETLEQSPATALAAPRGNTARRPLDQTGAEPAFPAELRLLARARAALATDPGLALSLSTRHGRLFSGGLLEQEREVVIIEALVRLDRGDAAAEKARAFWHRYPQSPYTEKVKRTVPGAFVNGEPDVINSRDRLHIGREARP